MNAADLAIWKAFSPTAFPNKNAPIQDYPQRLLDYVSGNLTYEGIAPRGAATSDAVWFIQKFAYDGDNNLISIKTSPSNQTWDGRAASTYA